MKTVLVALGQLARLPKILRDQGPPIGDVYDMVEAVTQVQATDRVTQDLIINIYHQLLPRVIEIIMAFTSKDEKKACDLFKILEELKEFAIAVIAPHVKLIVDMCLQIGSNSSISTNFQIKAIMLLLGIIRSKGKVVQKNKLVEPIIDVLIHLMAQDDEGNEEYFLWEPYQSTSINAATVTLNQIALHIPAEKVVPYLWTKVEPAIGGGDIYAQQGAYLSLAALAEGCPKHIIRTKYLEPFLKCVCTAIHNPNTVLRNAALFALGKFAEHLQPEISQYASEVLPVLFDCLAQVLQQMEVEKKDHPSLDRLFYALEIFSKNLEKDLMPYLPTLMERLFLALDPDGFSTQLKYVSLKALGAAATAVKQGILPYFERIIEMLDLYIISALDDLDDLDLEKHQIECYAIAIETLAVVAQFVGAENFNPLAVETLQRGLRILEMIIGPDVTKSVYALFAALAIVMKEELGPELPIIINKMIVTIQYRIRDKEEWPKILNRMSIQDRIKIHLYLDFDEKNWGKDFESFSYAIENPTMCHAYSMETSCNKAAIQACLAMGEICLNTGQEFLPFIEKSLEEIFKLVDDPKDTIRRASVKALQQFCIALYKVNTTESKQALYKALQMFVPKCSELIRTDKERWVVMNCLDAYASLLDEIKGDVFVGEGHREAIMNCVVDVLTLKTMCQDTDYGAQTENNEDDAEAEQDELLLESAGDVIPKFAAAITPDDFACYFPNVLELLSSRTVKQNSISQRSFAYGALAECMKSLDVYVEKFVPQLLKMWLTGARDAAEEVRKNSICGLGEMILHGKDRIFSHHNEILQALAPALAKETHAGTLYNICGALAKMNLVNPGYYKPYIPFEGRNKLYEAFENPEAVAALYDMIVTSSNPEIRQSATGLLREQLNACEKWKKLNVVIRNRIKQGMLQALVNEQEKSVKYAIAKFIGFIGRHELPENSWPEVLQFIHTLSNSSDTTVDKEMGLYSLSIMTALCDSSPIVQEEFFAMLFTNILGGISQPNSNSAYFTVMTMENFAQIIGNHPQMINVYQQLLPRVIEIIIAFLSEDDKKACDLFYILELLSEFAIAVIAPHVKLIVDMCLQIDSHSTNVQIGAISVVGWIIRSKGKVVQKNKLVEPIIDVLIHLMAQQPNDEGNEEYFLRNPYQSKSITVAMQTLNEIALYIPAEKVVPYLWTKVEPAIQGDNIYAQQAAYLSLAAIAEGCAEHIRTKYLEPFLKYVCTAIHNPNTVVRIAALFALGQFAEHLQPEISQYASEVLPVLFDCLAQVLQQMEVEKKDHPSLDRLFYAIEMFCKNLEEGLMPYLPTLMERLFLALDPNGFSIQLKCVSLRALGAAATAVKQGILPYFQKITGVINSYIISTLDDFYPEEHQIQCCAIETLAVVAQFVGAENFKPLAAETLQFGLQILEIFTRMHADVSKSVYALFAALAIVMKEELGPALPKIVNEMIGSIQYRINEKEEWPKIVNKMIDSIQDRIKIHLNLEDFNVSDENCEKDSTYEECFSFTTYEGLGLWEAYSAENSYNKAAEQACLALREICLNTGKEFLPFIDQSFEEIFKLVNYPIYYIRRASVKALQQFCIALYQVNTTESKQALYKALQMFVPKCSELIRTDKERWVVMNCLDAYASLLDEIKGDVFVGEGHREAIMNCVVDVLTLKTMCQQDTDFGAQTENNEDDAEAEQDELLLESAGDVIPTFAAAITPDDFACYFPNVLKLLSSRTVKQNSISQRSFAYGALAECMKSLDVYVEKFVPQLLKMWLTGARDAAKEVRKNSIFGLGEMILHGKDRIFSHYNEILQDLSQAVAKETHAGTLDNVCGALAKMILVNPEGIPLDQVLPAFLQKLPLRDHFQENEAVLKCFAALYQQDNPVLKRHFGDVMKIVVHIYSKSQTLNDETKRILVEFIKTLNRDFAQDFAHAVSSMGPEATESIQKLLS